MGPDQTLATYDRIADAFAAERDKTLFERPWLDRFLAVVPPPRRVLDLGCGTGRPIAQYLMERRAKLTGVDGAAAMLRLFEANVPGAQAVHADMRRLALGRVFDGILAWDSVFHLSQEDQRAVFAVFAAHAAPEAALMFTTGPRAGEAMGQAGGAPIYHASLDADTYRDLLGGIGFDVLRHTTEDPDTRGRTIWLARRQGQSNPSDDRA